MTDELYSRGMKIRREVLGDAYVDRVLGGVDEFSRDFQRLVTEYCWGTIWGRGGLERRQRSLINLGILAALNRPHEFETHFRAALRNGCSREELRETLLQIAVYAGIPAGVEVFAIARKVLSEAPAA